MELVLWDDEGGKASASTRMTGGGKTNILDVIRERSPRWTTPSWSS